MARIICACLLAAGLGGQPAAKASEATVYGFSAPPKGANPLAGLVRDAAGNFYGTTSEGGQFGLGVVYKLSSSGVTVLYSFKGGTDGANPYVGVTLDSAGNLYGTTFYGGAANVGVIYKVDSSGNETVLHSFTGGADGAVPSSGLTMDARGNLYGTTESGGATGAGTVYRVNGGGQVSVLYAFQGSPDGGYPSGDLVLDAAGNLYGTTEFGGSSGDLSYGVVYELTAGLKEKILYAFTGGTDGGFPSGLVRDDAGNLYGTTQYGGLSTYYSGVVYKVSRAGQQTVLYSFPGGAEGNDPQPNLVRDAAGNLYGTTALGGVNENGIVFKIDSAGNETVLYSFEGGATGYSPNGGLLRDASGDLYGTTAAGGAGNGVIFKFSASGNETLLFTLPQAASGFNPNSGVIRDSSGNLYGTAGEGGHNGDGTVFEIAATGNAKVLYSFKGTPDGAGPLGLARDSEGNFYGATASGGASDQGAVYKLDTAGVETVLYSFTGYADGGGPQAGVTLDPAGNLYGTTFYGGSGGEGVVYKVDPSGAETVLYRFTGGSDGGMPSSSVTLDAAGNLYGTTIAGGNKQFGGDGNGVVYKLDPSGNETVLYTFFDSNGGVAPGAPVILDEAGNIYGTTLFGGSSELLGNTGVVFKLDPSGNETVLYSFTGGADGGSPSSGLVRDTSGNLYGTTEYGGTENYGVVYKIDPAGNETVLHSFSSTDGQYPGGTLIRTEAGKLYGTARGGGPAGGGVLFEIKQ